MTELQEEGFSVTAFHVVQVGWPGRDSSADAFYADDWRVDISAQAASFGPEPLLVRLHHLASSLLHRPLPLSGTPSPCFLPEPFHNRRRKCTLCDQVEIFSLFQQSLTHMSNASNSHTPKYIQTHSLRLAKSQYTRERLRASLHRSQRHCMPLDISWKNRAYT